MSTTSPASWSINGRFLTHPQTGVQRYAREMTCAIDHHLSSGDDLARQMRWQIVVPPDATDLPRLAAIEVLRTTIGRGYVWEQTVLPRAARGGLISFANLGPLAHARQILCLHDANVYLAPDSYSRPFRLAYRSLFPLLARRARAVTTVSTFSSRMLAAHRVTGRTAARVVANGHEHALRWNAARSPFGAPGHFRRPFVFALGSRAKHKHLDLLLGLAPALDARGIDLVVSGSTSSIFAATTLAQSRNVISLGFVSDDDLAALFATALCFAFPSRTEGFGLPLLEAMVHGAPVLTTDLASMPEVCGEAALYAPPDDPAAWLMQIERMAAEPGLRERLRAQGFARFPRFSWRAGARTYLDLAIALSPRAQRRPETAVTPAVHKRTA